MKEVDEGKASVQEWWGADEKGKQLYSLKNWQRRIFLKPFYFQIRTSQNIMQKPKLLSVALCFYRNPLFPILVRILKYVLAQATDWCAGFLVRFWWCYLRVLFAGTVKWRVKVLKWQKKRRQFHYRLRSIIFGFKFPLYNLTEYPDLSTFPKRPVLSHV